MKPLSVADAALGQLIPPDAAIVVEISDRDAPLGSYYRSRNPHGQYWCLTPHDALTSVAHLPAGQVDCLVYNQSLGQVSDPVRLLQTQAHLLQDEGIILACLANSQHWRVLVNFLQGNWPLTLTQPEAAYPGQLFALAGIQSLYQQAGLSVWDIQAIVQSAQDLDRLIQELSPVLTTFRIDPQDFQQRSRISHYLVRATKTPLTAPKLLIQTYIAVPGSCGPVRVYDPDQFSATLPYTRIQQVEKVRRDKILLNIAQPDEAKVFIWQRTLSRYPDDIASQKALLDRGYLIVSEWDDDPRFWQQEVEHNFFRIRSSHCVQVATPALADFLSQFNPHVKVFANQLTTLPEPRTDLQTDAPILFFGGVRYPEDWQPIVPALNRILAQFPQVQIKVIHAQDFFAALETPRKTFYPFCPLAQYYEILRTCHIGILPLADTEFNRMKSDLKFLEHAGHHVVALASPIVYADSLIEGQTGLLYQSPIEFEDKLTQLIANPDWRQTIAANAYTWVRDHRLLSQHYRARRAWYLEMLAKREQLTADLQRRVPELGSP